MERYNQDPSKGGVKKDSGKTLWHLLPDELLEGVVLVLMRGAEKYDEWNWTNGMVYSRVYNSLRRHLNAFWCGEDLDPDDNLPHLDHLICNAIFLRYFSKRYPHLDDRPRHLKLPGPPQEESTTPRDVLVGDLLTKSLEATQSDRAQIKALGEAMHSARQIELLRSDVQPLTQPSRQEWNPPPPGSVLFEIQGKLESEGPEWIVSQLAPYVSDTDEQLVDLFQEGAAPCTVRVPRRRRNPDRGMPPID